MEHNMFIIYDNGEEAIVTDTDNEKETIKQFFTRGGRAIDDYDVFTTEDCAVLIKSLVHSCISFGW